MGERCRICDGEAAFVFSRNEGDGYIAEAKVKPAGYAREYYRCASCGLLFHTGFDDLGESQYALLPQDGGVESHGDGIGNMTNRAVRELATASRLIRLFNMDPGRMRLLVFGCGLGLSLNMFLKNGIDAYGTDLALSFGRRMPFPPELFDPGLAPEMLRRFITPEALAGQRFDVITMTEVFEHFTQPMEVMPMVAGLLREQGILYGTTGMADRVAGDLKEWWYLKCRTHVTFLTRKSFAAMCGRLGVSGLIFPNSTQFVGAAKMSDEQGTFVIQRP